MRKDLRPFVIFLIVYLGVIGFQYYRVQSALAEVRRALAEIRLDTARVNKDAAVLVKRDCINYLWAHRLHALEQKPNNHAYHKNRLRVFALLEDDYRHNTCR